MTNPVIKLAQDLPASLDCVQTIAADSKEGKTAQRIHEMARAVAEKRAPDIWDDIAEALDSVIVRYRNRICPDEVASLMKILKRSAPILQASEHASGPMPEGDSEAISHRVVCQLMGKHSIEWDAAIRVFLTPWGVLKATDSAIEDENNLLGLIRLNERMERMERDG